MMDTPEEKVINLDTVYSKIKEIIEYVLASDQVNEKTNMLELGADSVQMIRIINMIEDNLDCRLEYDDLYQNPTIDYISNYIINYNKGAVVVNALDSKKPDKVIDAEIKNDELLPSISDEDQNNTLPHSFLENLKGKVHVLQDINNDTNKKLRSIRKYSQQIISIENFSKFLSVLKISQIEKKLHGSYASAGTLYPVQIYIFVKQNRVESLPQGLYYYHPLKHQLIVLSDTLEIDKSLYDPLINAPIYEQAGFTIFFVSSPEQISIKYQRRWRDYCLIEAGSMLQLIRESSIKNSLGFCQIGNLQFDSISSWFDLQPGQECLISAVGGNLLLNSNEDDTSYADKDNTLIEDDMELLLEKLKVK